MPVRPPSDAVAALRGLGRRYRALFAGLGEDERPDDVAHRPGPEGRSALDHLVAGTRDITALGRALQQVLLEQDPVLPRDVGEADAERFEPDPGGTLEERLAELGWEADELASRAASVAAADWSRTGRVAGSDASVGALDLLWRAVDGAVAHLRAAERTIDAVRGRP